MSRGGRQPARPAATIVSDRRDPAIPDVSIVLLDWSVREHFQALRWLDRQTVERLRYELIWVELYDRVVPEARDGADLLVTCHQGGTYHKHAGYNVGLLHARGRIVIVCDSDAVFPPDFIASVLHAFASPEGRDVKPMVLMHYERRTRATYPDDLTSVDDLRRYAWEPLWPNVGACMSVRRSDAIRYGGFDEDASYRGYICGPYDLGWRLVNAGIPEVWHPEDVCLWHFAHPAPSSHFAEFTRKHWREVTAPHVDFHAWKAVEAFSTGRLLPLVENPAIHAARMAAREIGTPYEARYATMTGPRGFSRGEKLRLRLDLMTDPARTKWQKIWWRTAHLRDTAYFRPVRWLYRRARASAATLAQRGSR